MKILVPLDGSALASSILPTVTRLTELMPGAEIHLVTVRHPNEAHSTYSRPVVEKGAVGFGQAVVQTPLPPMAETRSESMERKTVDSKEWLEKIASEQFSTSPTVVHVEWDPSPLPAIIKVADGIDADVIVMATHGRTGLSHVLTGSVTEGVIRSSGRPVLVVGPDRKAARQS